MENGGAGHYSRCPHRSRYLMCGSFGIQKKDLLPSYFAAAALLPADKYIIRSYLILYNKYDIMYVALMSVHLYYLFIYALILRSVSICTTANK